MRLTLETLLTIIISLSVLAAIDCMIDIPGVDIPDLKDISPKDLISFITGVPIQ